MNKSFLLLERKLTLFMLFYSILVIDSQGPKMEVVELDDNDDD